MLNFVKVFSGLRIMADNLQKVGLKMFRKHWMAISIMSQKSFH